MSESHFSDAFHFLNLAAFAQQWPDYFAGIKVSGVGPASAPEKRLLRSPLMGPMNDYIQVTMELYQALGPAQFEKMYVAFIAGKERTHVSHNSTVGDFDESLISCTTADEFFLFDPGIEMSATFPTELRALPLAEQFATAVGSVQSAMAKARETRIQVLGNDLVWNMVRALTRGDGATVKKLFALAVRQQTVTGVEVLLALKAASTGLIEYSNELRTIAPRTATNAQLNAIAFARRLIARVAELSQ